jgi:hypothetical protein
MRGRKRGDVVEVVLSEVDEAENSKVRGYRVA